MNKNHYKLKYHKYDLDNSGFNSSATYYGLPYVNSVNATDSAFVSKSVNNNGVNKYKFAISALLLFIFIRTHSIFSGINFGYSLGQEKLSVQW